MALQGRWGWVLRSGAWGWVRSVRTLLLHICISVIKLRPALWITIIGQIKAPLMCVCISARACLHVHAHFGMCLFYLGDLISLYELMLSICTQSCQQYAFGYVRLCVCVCVCLKGEGGEVSKVPRQNNEGKWIPDGLFFLFFPVLSMTWGEWQASNGKQTRTLQLWTSRRQHRVKLLPVSGQYYFLP